MSKPFLFSMSLTLALLAGLCFTHTARAQMAAGATIQQIEDNPTEYYNSQVTVSGEVQDVWSGDSFTMGMGLFGEAILVVIPPDAQIQGMASDETPFSEDDLVQVFGTVERYVVAEIEDEYGFDFDDTEIEYERDEPALIANQLYVSPRGAGGAMGITLENLENDPQQYFGSSVIVSGEVSETEGAGSFIIGGGLFDAEILVLVPQNAKVVGGREGDLPYLEDDIVQVEGMVRPYVKTELENDFDFDFDFSETEIEYEEQKPSIVAGRVVITPRGQTQARD